MGSSYLFEKPGLPSLVLFHDLRLDRASGQQRDSLRPAATVPELFSSSPFREYVCAFNITAI
jgi:hypothetical protein